MKVIVSAVSLILVVGVALGVVAVVHVKKDNTANGDLSTHNKAVQAICQGSGDQKLCHETLGPVNTTDPKDYIKTVVESTLNNVIKALNMSDRLSVEHGKNGTAPGQPGSGVKMALDDCKDLMELAMDQLQASGVLMRENTLQQVYDRAGDLKNWLSSVIAYQQTCMDSFDGDGEQKVRSQLQVSGGLDDVGKLTALALDVVVGISDLLSAFNLNLNLKPASRRLLEVDQDGYPAWFSAADRKLLQAANPPAPNAVVAQDGSGQFKTIQEAVDSYPKKFQGRFVIYVKAGVYDEHVLITKDKVNILMYGDGPTKTIVTGKRSFTSGWKTLQTATFSTVAPDFIAKQMAFENTAGAEGHQAVALRVGGDRSAFFECAMHGYQDTLYAHSQRQFYRDCEISGTVDFIFGVSSTLIQNTRIIVRKPEANQQNIVVADGRSYEKMTTGIVLQNCVIEPDTDLIPVKTTIKSYLARPWKAYSRAIIMESDIGDFITPEGWMPWAGSNFQNTCYFAEFANTGDGANTQGRASWGKGVLSKADAAQYIADNFLQAQTWLPATGVPFVPSFTKA